MSSASVLPAAAMAFAYRLSVAQHKPEDRIKELVAETLREPGACARGTPALEARQAEALAAAGRAAE